MSRKKATLTIDLTIASIYVILALLLLWWEESFQESMLKLLNRCENVLTYLALLSTFIIMCLTTADAVGRYVFNRPIVGAYEITESYLMIAAVFLGICAAYRDGCFIRVSFFVHRLPRKARVILNYLVQIFSILLSLFFLLATIEQTRRKIASGIILGLWSIPVWPAYMIVSIGFFFITLLLILDLWRVREGKSSLFKEESTNL
jgi:TRAP-type C4-dicarboxylate transport system permease small subunit